MRRQAAEAPACTFCLPIDTPATCEATARASSITAPSVPASAARRSEDRVWRSLRMPALASLAWMVRM